MEPKSPNKKANLIATIKDLVAGATAGVISKIVEYPFDTIKTRLQTQGSNGLPVLYNGPIDMVKKVYAAEGVKGYFKGLSAPLYGAVLELCISFVVYGEVLRYFKDRKVDGGAFSIAEYVTAASVSGAATATALTPIELIKCRLQVQFQRLESIKLGADPSKVGKIYNGPIDCISTTIKEKGLLGMMRGNTLTLLRDVPANICWFGFYEIGIHFFKTNFKKSEDELPLWTSMIAGGMAGIGYWTVGLPADTIKSIVQTQVVKKPIGPIVRELWVREGLRGFYRGYVPTVLRAIPSNAVIFSVKDGTIKFINYFQEGS
eukprot:TRINITY_DN11828_c0_g1_i1.p1 TRINITY_DN11828_c0_g1~~TRINITY_DN11828_c0_g1_i1.p1  ORF type:complete len:317 (-),score=43.14 TRINITY_DN11828_c0_g1_i1:354-1304(-)